jgi:acetyltransferase-like isoleucine patch superfamily enzyme
MQNGLVQGENVFIDDFAKFKNPGFVIIGNNVAIDQGFYATTALNIGDYVHISPYVTVIGGKSSSFTAKGFNNIMTGARIICGSDRFDESGLFGAMIPKKYKGRQIIEPVVMEELSNIGTNAVVMPGSILRRGVLLTVGSVLFGDTEEWGIYKGNPATLVKKLDPSIILEKYNNLLRGI